MLANLLRFLFAMPLDRLRLRRVQALIDSGIARRQRGDLDGALRDLERAVELGPAIQESWIELGNLLFARGESRRAAECYGRALALAPGSTVAKFNLGLALREAGEISEAIAQFRRAYRDAPEMHGALRQLVTALIETDLCEKAHKVAAQAVESNPASYEAQLMLGFACFKLHEIGQALACYEAAAKLRGDDAELFDCRANANQALGRLPEAIADFDRSLVLRPAFQRARFHRGLARLMLGDFENGWPDYELRQISGDFEMGSRGFPRWDGTPLAGRTLLIKREQGLGDEIMFASILPEVTGAARHCVIECDTRLRTLFSRSFPDATVYGSLPDRKLPHKLAGIGIDAEIGSGSLPLYLRRKLSDFPRHQGYLRADPERVARWRERLAVLGTGPKLGISWAGGLRKTRRELRSIPLAQLLPILRSPGLRFVSLQYTAGAAQEVAELAVRQGLRVEHWPEAIEDYEETAALACALDHIVSVCTSLVHLGGALARPIWVMAPHSPEWRYGFAGESMPWYPTVRVFRQSAFGAWDDVIERVAAELGRHFAPPGR